MYIYSGTNILIMATKQELRQEPMTIIHEYNTYKHEYTINTNDKMKALRTFINELYRELRKVRDIPDRLLYLKVAWDMMNGDSPEEFNIIANRIKPGRNLSLKDFLYTPRYGKSVIPFRRGTYYSEKEDIDENDNRMKIFVGNFVFRVEPNTASLVELFQNVQNLYVISTNGRVPPYGFPYGYSVLGYDTLNFVRHVFCANFLLPIDPESDPFKFILNKIKEGTEMGFFKFVAITRTNMNMKTNTKTKTNAKLRL